MATGALAAAVVAAASHTHLPSVCALVCTLWTLLWLAESTLYNNHYYLYSSECTKDELK